MTDTRGNGNEKKDVSRGARRKQATRSSERSENSLREARSEDTESKDKGKSITKKRVKRMPTD